MVITNLTTPYYITTPLLYFTFKSRDCKSNAFVCGLGDSPQVVFAWALNASGLHLPEDVGLRVGADANINYLVVQIHYGDPAGQAGWHIASSPQPGGAGGGGVRLVVVINTTSVLCFYSQQDKHVRHKPLHLAVQTLPAEHMSHACHHPVSHVTCMPSSSVTCRMPSSSVTCHMHAIIQTHVTCMP